MEARTGTNKPMNEERPEPLDLDKPLIEVIGTFPYFGVRFNWCVPGQPVEDVRGGQ